ncbi:MAG TPA: ribbon-helix-helix domain-containing protein [Candidatus Sulfomarinibacteraceae bacterium]|jgi:Arc/MetJ-type ribon-helix-helix transcriptional regulator|nr:ribbon-helix-helix domain-containing protein [Candidatus Sulfomarinibacteraceae bacterium]
MRTTISIPDDIAEKLRAHVGEGSLSEFIREAVESRLDALRREAVVREMDAGYRAEAEEPSLDPEWTDIEVEGW